MCLYIHSQLDQKVCDSGNRIISSRSQSEVSNTVEVAEQSHVSFEGVDDQIGKRLLLLSYPGETSAKFILQGRNRSVC